MVHVWGEGVVHVWGVPVFHHLTVTCHPRQVLIVLFLYCVIFHVVERSVVQ